MAPARACFALPRPLAASVETLHISFCHVDLCFEGNEIGHACLGRCCLPGLRTRFVLLDMLAPHICCTIAERRCRNRRRVRLVQQRTKQSSCTASASSPGGTGTRVGTAHTHGQICFGPPAQIRAVTMCLPLEPDDIFELSTSILQAVHNPSG
jgi:hypothetical protein